MNLTLREMKKEDIDEVYKINKKSFTTDAWSREAIEREFNLSYSLRFVLEKDGKVIGYCFLWLIKGEAFLMTFALSPEHRGKGIGRIFLERIIERLKGKAQVLQLDVRKSNLPAIRLYRSLGFKIVRERPKFYSDGENALLMELELDKIGSDEGDKREEAPPPDKGGRYKEEGERTRERDKQGSR